MACLCQQAGVVGWSMSDRIPALCLAGSGSDSGLISREGAVD